MATQLQQVTAEDLLAMPDDGVRRELVNGELIEMTPTGQQHGRVAIRVGSRLEQHVEANQLGATYAAETGFQLASDPPTVRAPDAAFVRSERLAAAGDIAGYFPGAPDLAVEVVSPGDRFADVEEKVFAWLDAGARMVVVINPAKRTATVYRSRTAIVVLTEEETIDGGDVVPGWTMRVGDAFP